MRVKWRITVHAEVEPVLQVLGHGPLRPSSIRLGELAGRDERVVTSGFEDSIIREGEMLRVQPCQAVAVLSA